MPTFFIILIFLLTISGVVNSNQTTTELVTSSPTTTTTFTTVSTTTATSTITTPTTTLGLSDEQSSLDIVFGDFIQHESSSYSRALAVVVNISTRRVSFVTHGDRVGYAFGTGHIVRAHILVRALDDINEKTSKEARDQLVALITSTEGVHKDLQRYGVVTAFSVSEDPRLYTFKVYTNFDLIYTFIYVVTALLYASFLGFVIFKFVHQCLAEGEDKKNEEKEQKRLQSKEVEGNMGDQKGQKAEAAEAFDRSDVDKDRLAGISSAAARVERRLHLLALEEQREQRALHLKPQISPDLDNFLNMTSLPPPSDPSTDPYYWDHSARGGRPPLAPAHSPDRTVVISMDEL